MARRNRLAAVSAGLWLALWAALVFYAATAVFDYGARRSGFYSEEVADGN